MLFMAKVVEVKMNSAGARAILNSAEVQQDLLSRAQAIKARASAMGGVYEVDVQPGKNRAHAMVKTADFEAMKATADNNALLKSLDAGR